MTIEDIGTVLGPCFLIKQTDAIKYWNLEVAKQAKILSISKKCYPYQVDLTQYSTAMHNLHIEVVRDNQSDSAHEEFKCAMWLYMSRICFALCRGNVINTQTTLETSMDFVDAAAISY